jgi:hypothetical protein
VDRVQQTEPTPAGRRLLLRLCLLALFGGLLLLLSSRPADGAERQELGLLDPVGTTSKATAKEVGSLAGRATGSGLSTVATATSVLRQPVAPQPRPAVEAARATARSTAKRGAPAVTSPVRRVAPPTSPGVSVRRAAARPAGQAAKAVPGTTTGPLARVANVTAAPVGRVAEVAAPVTRPVGSALAPVFSGLVPAGSALAPVGSLLQPVGSALLPVGSALAPIGSGLAPVTGAVGGLVDPLVLVGLVRVPGGLLGPAGAAPAASAGPATELTDPNSAGPADLLAAASQTPPASAGSPGDRPVRSWPALTGAVHLPGVPASAELPAGGPDPLSTAWGAGLVLAALAAFVVPPGLRGRGRARLDRAGVLSRSYLPLVSPA